MNWSSIRGLVRDKLQDTTGKIWTDAYLIDWANRSLDDLTVGSEATIKKFRFPLVDGTRTYDMPADLYEIKGIRVNGQKIFGTSSHELEDLDRTYLNSTGRPEWYYLDGLDKLAFYKIPSWTDDTTTFDSELGVLVNVDDTWSVSAETGTTIEVIDDSMAVKYLTEPTEGEVVQLNTAPYVCDLTYVYQPVNLVNDTDTPDLPEYMQYAMIYKTCEMALKREGQGQDLKAAEFYAGRFNELKKEWFSRNREFWRGQDQMISMQPVSWGSDLDTRFRVWP